MEMQLREVSRFLCVCEMTVGSFWVRGTRVKIDGAGSQTEKTLMSDSNCLLVFFLGIWRVFCSFLETDN